MKQSIRELKGVGEKTERLFSKLGIYDTDALLRFYPRNYEEYEKPENITQLLEGSVKTIRGRIVSELYMDRSKKNSFLSVNVSDGNGTINVIWYHASYLKNTLKKGSVYVFRGKVVKRQGRMQMEHPDIFTETAYKELEGRLQPIYGLTAGLTNHTIKKLIKGLFAENTLEVEYLPDSVREKFYLADYNYAVKMIHFPENKPAMLTARRRLVFDEFLLFILAVQRLKGKTEQMENAFPMLPVETTKRVLEHLPYQLTKAQLRTWEEIQKDLCGPSLMARLVQGDVGSGKTIIAFLAMLLAVENGYQAVLMAPTEILACQHYESFQKLVEEEVLECSAVLLTGSVSAGEKKKIYKKIAEGNANIIIGTHALLQEAVSYFNLGLVITDEQHRFGVKQREALLTKGKPPHVLVMSATPIPRTLAIIIYGDLDISVIDELPAKRLPIRNCVVNTSYRTKAYQFIEKQVRAGRQVYIICPMVEAGEGMEAENVLDYTETIRGIFPSDITISFLHGKMKPKEKNQVMEEFADGNIQILVSTTVVEVGVNVPNAAVMMVENAERFGLAQLHQLRGRVGRGEHQSYCIFMQGNESKETVQRLEILSKSNDGFYIAGEDLRLRGPGDLFGIRQSGVLEFRIGDIYNDADLLKAASDAAGEILKKDRNLEWEEHNFLRKKLENYMKEELVNMGL